MNWCDVHSVDYVALFAGVCLDPVFADFTQCHEPVNFINDTLLAADVHVQESCATFGVKAKGGVQEWHLLYHQADKVTATVESSNTQQNSCQTVTNVSHLRQK